MTRIWAIKGTRPRAVRQQQFLFRYIFGAVCPSQKKSAAIIAPCANGFVLEEHLKEIAHHIPEGRHAVVIMDRAGWHATQKIKIPASISILHLLKLQP
ncbi:transposase [Candidatus Bealeia paramacronuclearis]|uniref:transposase n=1 Tax=Candidatus Bealeia paramacronuclearis TaxID=1921001 RepID=UPI0039C1C57E